MIENWYALCISILTNVSSEKALAKRGIAANKRPKKKVYLTEQQALNLKDVSKTVSWRELGEMFDINGEALRNQVYKAIKKATKEPTKVSEVAIRKNSTPLYHMEGGIQVVS